jgi:hypothetical protein
VRKVIERYLECGRLHQGFARIRSGDCGDEKLLAFSCQTRNLPKAMSLSNGAPPVRRSELRSSA